MRNVTQLKGDILAAVLGSTEFCLFYYFIAKCLKELLSFFTGIHQQERKFRNLGTFWALLTEPLP
jgi:hypothetical protein